MTRSARSAPSQANTSAHSSAHATVTRRALIGLAIVSAALASTSGCAMIQEVVTHQKEQHFDTRADAPTSGDLAFVLPSFLPDDASAIDLRVITNGPGAVLRYTSDTAITDSGCTAGDLSGAPKLSASWWPGSEPSTGTTCGSWNLFEDGGLHYGWKN